MKLLALAAVTLHGLASKVPKNQLLELDEGLNLRGHSGKKVQSPTLPTLDSDIYPVAPQDQLAAGVQAAGAQSPPGSALPRYHRKEEQAPNAFPETASKAGRQVLLTYSVNQENKFMLTLQEGPDAHGVYTILWADSGVASSAVRAMHMRHTSGRQCGWDPWDTTRVKPRTVPRLPSLLLRMHWEASDFRWRSNALSEIKKEVLPDEVVSDFDWHVILRYGDQMACEKAHEILRTTLTSCQDPNSCYRHPYVRAIEYVSCHEPAS